MSSLAQWLLDLLGQLLQFVWRHGQQFLRLGTDMSGWLAAWLSRWR